VDLLSRALDWLVFVDVARSSLDLIVRFAALVNEHTKQATSPTRYNPLIIFSTIEVSFLLFDSVAYLSVGFSFALRPEKFSDSLPLVASRSAFYHPLGERRLLRWAKVRKEGKKVAA
jgi:hypothetical protein